MSMSDQAGDSIVVYNAVEEHNLDRTNAASASDFGTMPDPIPNKILKRHRKSLDNLKISTKKKKGKYSSTMLSPHRDDSYLDSRISPEAKGH